jgi:4-amino-4-deoxy-L-arabinose transferase-like glycosyltransferase
MHILDASRTAVTFVTTLLIPLVFLAGIALIGGGWAFTAALLLACDPRTVAYTRIAHIDGMLTLCVAVTIFAYLRAVMKRSLFWKFIAALGWGTCLLTKPTGALVLPVLLLYRLIRFLRRRGETKLLEWSDVWVVIISHAVFVGSFTRLWDRRSHYISRLKVDSPFAKEVLQAGKQISEMETVLLIAALGVVFVITALFFCWRQVGSRICYHVAQLLSVLAIVGALFAVFPVVLRNLILYWTWVSGLSGVKHEAFGKVFESEDAAGYLTIVGGELPEAALILFLLGALLLVYSLFQQKSETTLAKSALLIAVIVWLVFLGTSSKQALRYALPVVPFVYLLGASFLSALAKRSRLFLVSVCIALLALGAQVYTYLDWQPYQHAYFNRFVGGLAGAQNMGRGYLFAGQIPAVEYLVDRALGARQPLYITVGGDLKTLEGVLKKHWPDLPVKINFGQYSPGAADYVIRFNSHRRTIPESYAPILKDAIPAFTVPFQDATLVEIFSLPPLSLVDPLSLSLHEAHRLTGDLLKSDGETSLRAQAEQNPAGYLFFNDGVRLVAGDYLLTAKGTAARVLTNKNLFRLELGKACTRIVRAKVIEPDGKFEGKVVCTIEKETRVIPRIYWYGIATVTVSDLTLKKLS